MARKSWLKIALCLIAFGSFGQISARESSFEWSGEKYVGDWNGSSSYREGWSSWSTEIPTNPNNTMYVKAKVYIPVSSWGGRYCVAGEMSKIDRVPASGGTVRKPDGTETERHPGTKSSELRCDGPGKNNFWNCDGAWAEGERCKSEGPDGINKIKRCSKGSWSDPCTIGKGGNAVEQYCKKDLHGRNKDILNNVIN